ncbi:CRISPR-associated protein Csb3 [Micromonospora sp. Llam0]|uniref:hypothetical protein n=1 Tax=Micromonospora sp. Llam0 TaxID=2485143 RepID=UPI000F49391D|nr:hypothetical protein [Micromonospora sp. Llam0]ROO60923.1 CRISPR-associated protein Csb3 [Micromonospora sp. Llam0]
MTDFVLSHADPYTMLSHMTLYGFAAIAEDAGLDDVRLSWTPGMNSRPVLSAPEASLEAIGEIVRRHAARHDDPDAWPSRQLRAGEQRALMSPRISVITTGDGWRDLQHRRHQVLDQLTDARAMLDLQLIAALGEPAYWSRNGKGDRLQDDGASRLEMQPRNQGSEFVGNRLRPLAAAVAARTAEEVADGLAGRRVRDEIAKDKPDSRTPTGFAAPSPTDNAVAWCALWGISQFPIAQRVNATATTTGHLGRATGGWFCVPVWTGRWRTARHRTVLASGQLARFAAAGLSPKAPGMPSESKPVDGEPARGWLAARGVTAVIRFPVQRFGSDSAPERRAMRGEPIKIDKPLVARR